MFMIWFFGVIWWILFITSMISDIKSCGKAKCEAPPDLKITQFQGHLFLEIFTLHQINHTYLKYILLDTKYPTWHHRMNLVHFCASGQCRSLPLLQTDWGSQNLSQFAAKTQPIMTWNLLLCVWVKQTVKVHFYQT